MATDLNIEIKINNQSFSSLDTPVRTVDGPTIFTWVFDDIDIVDVDETDGTFEIESIGGQSSIEIAIADNDIDRKSTR